MSKTTKTRRIGQIAWLYAATFAGTAAHAAPSASGFSEVLLGAAQVASGGLDVPSQASGGTAVARSAPSVSAEVNASGNIPVQADASLTYYFEVNGPAGGVPLVDISGAVFAVAGGSSVYFADGFASVIIDNKIVAEQTSCSGLPGQCGSGEGSGRLSFNLTQDSLSVGTEGMVYLHALGAADGGGFASASADPSISIDPSTPDAALYSITVSDGIGNPAPVPEPTSLALLVSGLLGFAALCRRQNAR